MKQAIKTEYQVPCSLTYNNGKHSYNIQLKNIPLLESTVYDFVWDSYRLQWHMNHTIETWAEPLSGETLNLTVCLINVLESSPYLLLTSHVITVVVADEE